MQFDHEPCHTCGSPVRLEARTAEHLPRPDGPVGPAGGDEV